MKSSLRVYHHTKFVTWHICTNYKTMLQKPMGTGNVLRLYRYLYLLQLIHILRDMTMTMACHHFLFEFFQGRYTFSNIFYTFASYILCVASKHLFLISIIMDVSVNPAQLIVWKHIWCVNNNLNFWCTLWIFHQTIKLY